MERAMPLAPLVLLVAALALCAYTYLGYPAILGLLRVARRAPPHSPRRCAADWPTISIALPVYNEVEGIADTLERILAIEYPAERRQILVVSDASTDGTDEIVTRFAHRCGSTWEL
jgi:cellulose synthase/poly-beta-1,6-N-acetylglucosamine synthase-like glycosyltransferase